MPKPDDTSRPLSSYLQPSISTSRVERNRAAVRHRLERKSPFRGVAIVAIATCAAALAFVVWGPLTRLTHRTGEAALAWQVTPGAVLEAEQSSVVAKLPDGTHIELSTATTLAGLPTRPDAVELELRRGHASFDVAHNPARQFRVHAGTVTVIVLGTRFSVGRREDTVTVVVERGKVAVQRGSEVTHLTPGQRWQAAERDTGRVSSGNVPWAPQRTNPDSGGATPENSSPDQLERVEVGPVEPVRSPQAAHAVKPNASGSTAIETEPPSPAKELFDASREARRVGDSRRAAQLLQQLVAQYPGDRRAGLAAFELGRIRADVLGDLPSAISALQQALRLSPQGSFRQDALARLAQAYDRTGQIKACKAAKQRYLAAHGEGVHAQRVLQLCP